jgi:hypothetical protein
LKLAANAPREYWVRFSENEKMQKEENWLAVDAVPCELFSRLNSLLTGKNTGKFLPLPRTI